MIDILVSIKEFKDLIIEDRDTFNVDLTTGYAFNCLCNYIDIMDLTLELGKFVACVDGVPLDWPKHYFEWATRTLGTELTEHELHLAEPECREYQEAESKILFNSFEYSPIKLENLESWKKYKGIEKVKDLLKLGLDIELTEAFKQLITK